MCLGPAADSPLFTGVNRVYCRITVDLSLSFFAQDFLSPAQSRVGSREPDGSESEDDSMQDLLLRDADPEQFADMRTHAALRLRPHGYPKLDQPAFPYT